MDIWTSFFNQLDKITEGKTSSESLNYATHISLKHKYIFVETPKVACSSIKLTLQRLELEMNDLRFDNFKDVHIRNFSPLLQLSQIPKFEVYLKNKDFFKFCFVRNPYSRLLSCYLDKISTTKSLKEKQIILQAMGKEDYEPEYQVSFKDFVGVIENQSLLEMDYHWRPQTYLTCQSTIKYDFVGRIENFENDFDLVGEKISPDFKKYYSKELRHQTDANKLLNEYYDQDLFRRVYDLYKVDFDNFSYNQNH